MLAVLTTVGLVLPYRRFFAGSEELRSREVKSSGNIIPGRLGAGWQRC